MTEFNYCEKEELRTLLNRFYSGNTTLAEEKHLRELLDADSCSDDFKSDRDIISMLAIGGRMPCGFRDDIIKDVRHMARRSRFKRIFVATMSVAESIAIVAVSWSYAVRTSERPRINRPSTPENAILQARQALMSISRELNDVEILMPEHEELLNRMVVNNEVEMDEFMIEVNDSCMSGSGALPIEKD